MRDSLKKKTSTEETTSNPDKKKKKVLWFDKNINEAGYVGRNLSKMVDLKCFKKFDSFYDFLFK